ncbi:MAG: hypothetical protein LAT51_00990 [Flavobacteriaceae bacterium]|nr:hypothetical protein [Flavobacteriaceae bacterium]
MKKYLSVILLCLVFVACSSDDDFAQADEFVDVYDQNSVNMIYDGMLLSSEDSIQTHASFCCEKNFRVTFSDQRRSGARDFLHISFDKNGNLINVNAEDIFNIQAQKYITPFFKVPEPYFQLHELDFDAENLQLDLSFNARLLQRGTKAEEGKFIDVEVDTQVGFFGNCDCSDSAFTMRSRAVTLQPNLSFTQFYTTTSGPQNNRKTAYKTKDNNGYYFELGNLSAPIYDLPLGIYDLGTIEATPILKLMKYDGLPHTLLNAMIVPDEWMDYEIEGHFEIIEKLDHNLTRSKLTFTASLDGEVVYEFVEAEMVL